MPEETPAKKKRPAAERPRPTSDPDRPRRPRKKKAKPLPAATAAARENAGDAKKHKKRGRKRTKRFRIIVGTVVLLAATAGIALLLWPELSSLPGSQGRRRARGSLSGSFFFTCNLNGRITPCGCEEGELGGITRAAAVYADWAKDRADHIVLDIGNAAVTHHAAADTVNRFAFEALERLGCVVANCGVNEVVLSDEQRARLTKGRTFPLISANFVRTDTGKPVLPPHHIVARGGVRIAFIGLLDHQFEWATRPDNRRLLPEEEALGRAIPAVEKLADLIVVLAFVPPERLYELSKKFPKVGIFIGGRTLVCSADAEVSEHSAIAYLGDEGCSAARLDFDFEPGQRPHAEFTLARLDAKVDKALPSVPAFAKLVGKFEAALGDQPRPGSDWNARMPCTSSYVGSDVCALCHPKVFFKWYGSAHAGAYASLLQKREHRNPQCLACHTTGYGKPNGYVPDPVPPLIQRLKSGNASLRKAAIAELVELPAAKTVPELLLALSSSNDPCRAAAYECLGQITQRPDRGVNGTPRPPTGYDPAAERKTRDLAITAWQQWWKHHRENLASRLLAGQKRPQISRYPLASVGCESCHGGARRHLGEALLHRKNPSGAGLALHMRPEAALYNCQPCHNSDRPCRPDGKPDPYTVNERTQCKRCAGAGKLGGTLCKTCQGTGKVHGVPCDGCKGTGHTGGTPCTSCSGSGRAHTREQYIELIRHWGTFDAGKGAGDSFFTENPRSK